MHVCVQYLCLCVRDCKRKRKFSNCCLFVFFLFLKLKTLLSDYSCFLLRTDCLSQPQTLGTPSLAPSPPPSNFPIGESYTVPPPELEPEELLHTHTTDQSNTVTSWTPAHTLTLLRQCGIVVQYCGGSSRSL